MKLFGLLGKKLSHSFSKSYFTQKFKELGLSDHEYQLFEIDSIDKIEDIKLLNPIGLNVTVPYKQVVIPHLDELDASAKKVGAVNVIHFRDNRLIGYNSDYFGFKASLQPWLSGRQIQALILGSGGASKAVEAVLNDLNINYKTVSRSPKLDQINYDIANQLISQYHLIINTTPLGMSPDVLTFPPIAYQEITQNHYLYDLVYNPEETAFLKKGKEKGSKTKNGLEMLHLQAEESWRIWSSN